MISACARGQEFWKVFVEKPMGFLGFYVKIITKPKVLEGFRLARERKKNVHFTLFFARDYWKLMMWEPRNVSFYCFLQGKTGYNKKPDPDLIDFSEAFAEK